MQIIDRQAICLAVLFFYSKTGFLALILPNFNGSG